MAIWLTKDTRVIVQGMTGSEGSKHTRRMLAAGTNIVGGVNPRKAGSEVDFDGDARCRCSARVADGDGRDRRRRHGDLRAADVRQGRGRRGDRRRHRARRRDHRGHPGARHRRVLGAQRRRPGSGPGSSARTARASPRPGESNAGIIPADITGAGRIGLVSKSGHADLPDDVRAARHRLLDLPSASAATRSSARPTSTRSRRSRTTPRPTRS